MNTIDLNQKCRIVLGASRDLVELQRLVVDYNDRMYPDCKIEIEHDGEFTFLIGEALSLFQVGVRYGEVMERKYLKGLGSALRDIII